MAISAVALVVIGPEKLPQVARTLGAIIGKFQRMVAQVKEEVSRETRFEELQQLQQEIATAEADIKQHMEPKIFDEAQHVVSDVDSPAPQNPAKTSRKKTATKQKTQTAAEPSKQSS